MATETVERQTQDELTSVVEKPSNAKVQCKQCGATNGVERHFTGIGLTLCLGLCCFMGVGACLAYVTRRRHCQKCFTISFEQDAMIHRREVCFIDDKSLRPAPTPCIVDDGVNVVPHVAK